MKRYFEEVGKSYKKNNSKAALPSRGSAFSAGWDFRMPKTVTIQPKQSVMVWTDVKAHIKRGEVLMLYMRSSLGVKKHLMLANTVGVIDADYADNPSNDGNIGVCLFNYGEEPVTLEQGDRFCQGVCVRFLPFADSDPAGKRTGGFGSTGKA